MWGDPAGQYARYCDHVARLIHQYARRPVESLLDIACGGGKNVFNLRKQFQVTGLDLSPAMLKLARALNPACEFVEGDMRAFSLERTFDAILMDDGISHLTDRAELSSAFERAFSHLNPGGVMVVTPDATAETFRQNQTVVTPTLESARPEQVDVVFIENVYDPDPQDEQYEATLLYLIRESGRLRIEVDRCTLGLFSRDVWKQTLSEARFEVREGPYAEEQSEYTSFACTRPR